MSGRRIALWGCLLFPAGCLYFFENGTGTRIVLACALLLPLIPAVRRALFTRKADHHPAVRDLFVSSFRPSEEEEPGDARPWLPGDPVNRIHWKLSAKKDELLVRPPIRAGEPEETLLRASRDTKPKKRKSRLAPWLWVLFFACLLLFLVPEANRGFQALCNRLFEASEQRNAYVYRRFDVPAGQPVAFAACLLAGMLAALAGLAALSRSRLPAAALWAGAALFQVYFGLPLPGWVQVLLFALLLLCLLRPRPLRDLLVPAAGILVLSLCCAVLLPGTHAATEEASERARDLLSRMAETVTGGAQELPEGEKETRHVHTRSLAEGDQAAGTEKEYRPVTVEEEQVSIPRWIDWLKMILLFLGVAALPVAPFLPFLWLNARRRRASEARAAFRSDDIPAAVRAAFQHVIAWLETAGLGAGTLPYRDWAEPLSRSVSEAYAGQYLPCAGLFERAAYSRHPLTEEDREQVLALLGETERILRSRADRKLRFRLKYREFLWI